MLAFRPKEKPLFARILSNTAFQLVALVLVIGAMFAFARQMRHREIEERISEIENAQNTQVVARRMAGAKTESASTAASTAKANPNPNPAPAAAGAQAPANGAPVPPTGAEAAPAAAAGVAAAAAPGDASASAASATGTAASKAAQTFAVSFIQISHAALGDILQSADPRASTTQGPVFSGMIANLASRLKSAEGYEVLDSSTNPIKLNQAAEFHGGQREDSTGQFLGFIIETTPTQADDAETHFQLRAWRYLRDGTQVEEFALPVPEAINLPRGSGLVIAGALPRRNSETDRAFYQPLKVLRILSNDDYRNGNLDLVISVEAR